MNTVCIEEDGVDSPSSQGRASARAESRDTHAPIANLVLRSERKPESAATKASLTQSDATPPVVALTHDQPLATQLASALDGTELSTTTSIEDAEAVAAAGKCAIVVTDCVISRNALEDLKRRLCAHDPATVVVACGNRDQSALFIGLQSSGAIDAFLLKPITAAATQLVFEGAIRRYRSHGGSKVGRPQHPKQSIAAQKLPAPVPADDIESGDTIEAKRSVLVAPRVPTPTPVSVQGIRETRSRPSWTLFIATAIVLAAIAGWSMIDREPASLDAEALIAKHLALAQSALAQDRLLDAHDGAVRHFQTVLAVAPDNLAAHRGIDSVAHALSRRAQAHMSERRLAEAAIALEELRQLQPRYAELALLDAQLRQLQDTLVASYTPAAPKETANAAKPAAVIAPQRKTDEPRGIRAAPEVKSATSVPTPQRPLDRTPMPEPKTQGSFGLEQPRTAPEQRLEASPSGANKASSDDSPVQSTREDSMPPSVTPAPIASTEQMAASLTPAIRPGTAPVQPTPQPKPTATAEPVLAKYVAPTYPSEAYARNMEGWIEISVEINAAGDVLSPRIEDGERRQLFGRAALGAVRQWKYEPDPTRKPGERFRVRVEFRLRE